RVHEKAVPAVDDLVAGPGIGARQEADELVGAGAADDARRIEPVAPGDRLAQRHRPAIGIAVDLLRLGAIGLDGARARTERALVRGEADDARHALDLGLAADIGSDVEDAGPRCRVLAHIDRPLARNPKAAGAKGLA